MEALMSALAEECRLDAWTIRRFHSQGWLQLPAFLGTPEVNALSEFLLQHRSHWKSSYGQGLLSLNKPFERDPITRDWCRESTLSSLANRLAGAACTAYGSSYTCKLPSSPHRWYWHQDAAYHAEVLGRLPESGVTFWIPLVDTTPENGCLRVVPGSHNQGLLAHGRQGNQFAMELSAEGSLVIASAGDLVAFHNRLIHGSYGNSTDTWRPALIVEYVC
jgi:hypothetical protein